MAPGQSLVLHVRNLGHVPSFKNGRQLFLTSKRNREWMKRCTDSFVSQLLSKCQTADEGTLTAVSLRSSIVSLPADDNWKIIPQIVLTSEKVIDGEEGATIEITPLD